MSALAAKKVEPHRSRWVNVAKHLGFSSWSLLGEKRTIPFE
jgi:hypothetical protein